jgi:tRNA threonylcarbamoyl adenosine modification protein YeaZ
MASAGPPSISTIDPVLLAIDTSAGTSVAIVDRERGVLAERDSLDTRGHAEVIGEFIAECLEHARVAPHELSGVVAGMGPGPFTGLRVGIAAAKAFALGIGRPLVPLVSHDAVAFELAAPVLVATDARRRELYFSVYGEPDALGLPTRIEGPSVVKAADLPQHAHPVIATRIRAASLGLLAETLYAAGRPFAADTALYLRSPDVTMSAGPKRVS